MLSALVGIGYVDYFFRTEDARFPLDGIGAHGLLRATHLLSKRLDLGAEIGGYSSCFTPPALEIANFDENTRIKYISIARGLHLHF